MIQTILIAFTAFVAGLFLMSWHYSHWLKSKTEKGDRGFVEKLKTTVTPENKAEYVRNIAIAMLAASTLLSAILFVGSLMAVVQSKAVKAELANCLRGTELERPILTTADYEDEDD